MKNNFLTLLIISITLLVGGCKKEESVGVPYPWGTGNGALLYPDWMVEDVVQSAKFIPQVEKGEKYYLGGENGVNICLQLHKIHRTKAIKKWCDEEVPDLVNKMNEQFEPVTVGNLYYDAAFYTFTTIKAISIKANKNIYGREAGSELADLFGVYNDYAPCYSYPDGNLIYKPFEVDGMPFAEWIDKELMPRSNFLIRPLSSEEVELGDVLFTINISFANGTTTIAKLR